MVQVIEGERRHRMSILLRSRREVRREHAARDVQQR